MGTVTIRDDGAWVCVDCLVLLANDDTEALCDCGGERDQDHAATCPAAVLRAAVAAAIEAWWDDVPARYVHVSPASCQHDENGTGVDEDPDGECVRDTFSRARCPLCGSRLAGERHAVRVIARVPW